MTIHTKTSLEDDVLKIIKSAKKPLTTDEIAAKLFKGKVDQMQEQEIISAAWSLIEQGVLELTADLRFGLRS